MLFDLDYDNVPISLPIYHNPGTSEHREEADQFVDAFSALADACGYSWRDFSPDNSSVLAPKRGFRYFIGVRTGNPNLTHCLAIDENGTAFDPDPSKPETVNLSSYEVILIVELSRKS